jgi:hypothetical protein
MTNLDILFIVILFMSLFWLITNMHLRYIQKRARYNLFKLRDELRMYAIKKEIDANSEAFTFYDMLISDLTNELYYFNVYSFLTVYFYNGEKHIKRAHDIKKTIIQFKEDFPCISEIDSRINKVILDYLWDKDFLTKTIFICSFLIKKIFFTKKEKAVEKIRMVAIDHNNIKPQTYPNLSVKEKRDRIELATKRMAAIY